MEKNQHESSELLGTAIYWGSLIWLCALGYKKYIGAPILYQLLPDISIEAFFALGIAALFLLALLLAISKRMVTGTSGESFVLGAMAPVYCVVLVGAWAAWIWHGTAKGANHLPMLVAAAVSGVSAYLWRFGFLANSRREHTRQELPTRESDVADEPARVEKPRKTFADIHGNAETKARLKAAADVVVARRGTNGEARNGILLHGLPRNGKTAFAEALAGELGLPLVRLSYADVASEWVGKKTAAVRAAFAQAVRSQPCVFFIDEVDSFLEARDAGGAGVKEDRDLVNAMLTLMTDIRRHRVILVAATNFIDRLDAASIGEGRFDLKVDIPPPDLPARIGLLKQGLDSNAPGIVVSEETVQRVAARWNGYSVKRILAVTEELRGVLNGKRRAEFSDFMAALRVVQGQRGSIPEDVKPLSDLVMSERSRRLIDEIVGRMADPEHTERYGGTLPTGVLFHGEPGTGKTATAKAIARELGWAFLPATGAELARDPRKLDALHNKAMELRPAIIFVDEADELLRDRAYSPATDSTNKLLTLMDGVHDRVRDVVWVAATNNPDQIDGALLRGGRFTEKVLFELPSADALARHLVKWLAQRNVQLEDGFTAGQFAEHVSGQSIANAEAIAQAALNRAVSRRTLPVVVTAVDADEAVRTVLG
ncbi:AAA family ATPase [Ramlibacter albus]|uniref:ATP-binding protein n=1 Tax=Ramlibacter albus TaxID=2079448 RepID=A0A923S4L5_9BURK|nr:ATP-binding protein [Ramlibacter albus]MBC5767630.1 ATP-binding protein [Ramlibacter albus]